MEEYSPAPAKRAQRRTMKTAGAVIAAPVATVLLRLLLGGIVTSAVAVAVIMAVLVMVLVVFTMTVSSSPDRRERAFRLLRWLRDRPEPPGPQPAARRAAGGGWPRRLGR